MTINNDSLPSSGSRLYLGVVCLVAAIGGLLFGFDTAVISGTVGFLRAEFGLSPAMEGWTASSALVGCILGALVAGALSDWFGRRRILLLAAILFTVSALFSGLPEPMGRWSMAAWNGVIGLFGYEPPIGVRVPLVGLIVARIIGGVGVGMASMLSPMYIAEIAPPRIRGRLVSLQQFAIISGILAAYFSNAFILNLDFIKTDAARWRWMFEAETGPAALFFFLLLFVPESPRWLTRQGRGEEAMRILGRVAGAQRAREEMAEIQDAISHEGGSIFDMLKPGLRLALMIGILLAIFQQVTGINAILYYAPEIFKNAGSGAASAFSDTVWVGIFNLLFTVVAILVIDHVGRKPLLLVGTALMGLSLLLVGLAFHFKVSGFWLLVVILAYVSAFAASQGPVVWVINSEIFPTRIRGRAMSVATVCLWIACYLVSQTFPMLTRSVGSAVTFWVYGSMCALSVVFVALLVPETKGRSLEEIEARWTSPEPAHAFEVVTRK